MKKILLLAALLASTSAFAQQPVISVKPQQQVVWDYSLMVNDRAGKPAFKMGPDACLVGPLEFIDEYGGVSFQLPKGVAYPTGCTKNGEKQ
jgi:hypothetical protein